MKPRLTPSDWQANTIDEPVLLPQSEQELDAFIACIVHEFELPDDERTYEAIVTDILHLNQSRAHAPRTVFGWGVQKQIANAHAFERAELYRKKREEKAKLQLVPKDETPASEPQPIQNA